MFKKHWNMFIEMFKKGSIDEALYSVIERHPAVTVIEDPFEREAIKGDILDVWRKEYNSLTSAKARLSYISFVTAYVELHPFK